MPPELFAEAIAQFEALRTRLGVRRSWIQLSGGEPMLHPRIGEMLAHSASCLPTRVLTNGTLIDPQAAALGSDA
jgi:molybdenum cofactor biosynthesis enzyme MoaA